MRPAAAEMHIRQQKISPVHLMAFSGRAFISRDMAQTYFIFNFGNSEDVAQQARHRLDSWRQRSFISPINSNTNSIAKPPEKEGAPDHVEVNFVRLDFSDHEKLSHRERWIDRIPTEAPFKDLVA